MREDICTIPVSEIFEVKDGCPFCRLHDVLEERVVDYITGAAMMEPDVRHETNRLGFCGEHFSLMLQRRARLPLALILESHLMEVEQSQFAKKPFFKKKSGADKAGSLTRSCFVCEKIDWGFDRLLATFFRLWASEPEFRALVSGQPVYCLPHYAMLLREGASALDKKKFAEFSGMLTDLVHESLSGIKNDVSEFCSMFDYHNSRADLGNSRDSVERAIKFLTGSNRL